MDKRKAIEIFTTMMLTRKAELKIEELYHLDEMKTPVHLCLGQEAVSSGVCANLKKDDCIFSNHRGHGHYLAKGGDLNSFIAELYCRQTGCSKGRGGSMHLIDKSAGHLGSSAIVAGGIPHAVGAALAFKLRKQKLVAVSFFGDAASEEGVFYESMNLSALKKLPVVFVCENNKYSVCSHISVRQPNNHIYKRARAFDIPSKQIDGMNVVKVYEESKKAVEHARKGKGPFLLEFNVQRWRGHAGAGDPGREIYRDKEDLNGKNHCDPVLNFKKYLLKNKISTEVKLAKIEAVIDKKVADAFEFALKSPLPSAGELDKYLFVK